MDKIFYTNLTDFLENNKNDYSTLLLKENSKYKMLYDSLYSNLRLLSKKLPETDTSVDNLFLIFSEISQFETSFSSLKGLKDCKKIKNFIEF